MRAVWKYRVSPRDGIQTIDRDARPVALAEQEAGTATRLTMWVETNPTDPHGLTEFAVVGTGWGVPEGFEHADTCVTSTGYVWHLYRRPS